MCPRVHRGSLAGVSSILPALDLRDLTTAAGLGSKHLYPLNHLTGLKKQLLRIPLGKVGGPVPGDPAEMEGRGGDGRGGRPGMSPALQLSLVSQKV